MVAIFVEVVREVLVAVVWIALWTLAMGMGCVLVAVGLALALRDARGEGDWVAHLKSTARLLLARGAHPAVNLVSLPARAEGPAGAPHAAAGDHPPHRLPEPTDEARRLA